jgi:hypothetical protein
MLIYAGFDKQKGHIIGGIILTVMSPANIISKKSIRQERLENRSRPAFHST